MMLNNRVTLVMAGAVVAALLATSILIRVLNRLGKTSDRLHAELIARLRSWYLLTAFILTPILLGAFYTWLFLAALSFRLFARVCTSNRVNSVPSRFARNHHRQPNSVVCCD